MNFYRVPITYLFQGYFDIVVESADDARRMATQDCGLVLGAVHTTLDDDDVDWEFDIHPAEQFGHVSIIQQGV